MKNRLFIDDMAHMPKFPLILELNSELIPIENEDSFWRRVPPDTLQSDYYYLAIDSDGQSWQFQKHSSYYVRFFKNFAIPRISKQMFVDGFNRKRKEKSLSTYFVKITHKQFRDIFSDVYSLLSQEKTNLHPR